MGLTARQTGKFRGMIDKIERTELLRKEEENRNAGKSKPQKKETD